MPELEPKAVSDEGWRGFLPYRRRTIAGADDTWLKVGAAGALLAFGALVVIVGIVMSSLLRGQLFFGTLVVYLLGALTLIAFVAPLYWTVVAWVRSSRIEALGTKRLDTYKRLAELVGALTTQQPIVQLITILELGELAANRPYFGDVVKQLLAAFVRRQFPHRMSVGEHREALDPSGAHRTEPEDRHELSALQAAITVLAAEPARPNLDLRNVDFSDRDLTDAFLDAALLTGSSLRGARCRGARLESANLDEADCVRAILARAKLASASLRDAQLNGADLTGADLRFADLTNASAIGASFEGADLRGANLTGARLTGANLSKVRLDDAYLLETNVDEAVLDPTALKSARVASAGIRGQYHKTRETDC